MDRFSKHINILLIVLFLLVLVAPNFIAITKLEKIVNSENRKKTAFPKLSTLKNPIKYLTTINNYYKTNFGLRHTLSNFYLSFKFNNLKESPLPAKVIMGKNDFLFLGNNFNNVVKKSTGFKRFSKKELYKIKESILEKKAWLKSKNIAFYMAIAPNKHVVYKENLPFKFVKSISQKEALINYIKKEIDFTIIDLGKQFNTQKTKHRLYQKHDSHWNELGAFFGYQTLINEISKNFPIQKLKLSDFNIETKKHIGDISKMIHLDITKDVIALKQKNKINIDTLASNYYDKLNIDAMRFKNKSKKYKILVFRDSFSSHLIKYLNQTFGECTYIWSYHFDKKIVLKEKPDIVILENVERYLDPFKE